MLTTLFRNALTLSAALVLCGIPAVVRAGGRDVLETRKGERFLGTVTLEAQADAAPATAQSPAPPSTQPAPVALQTAYGQIAVDPGHIYKINALGETYMRQQVVMEDTEAFSGRLADQAVRLELPSGQVMHVPLAQVKSIEFHPDRATASDSASQKFHPLLTLRSHDTLFIQPPTAPIPVITRYGAIDLPASAISEIVFHKPDGPDPDMYLFTLVDGSTFGGFVNMDAWPFHLDGTAGQHDVRIPTGELMRLQLTEKPAKPGSAPPATGPAPIAGQLKLANDDLLVGGFTGRFVLDTAFDPVTIEPAEITAISRSDETHAISITLWDATTVTGELTQPAVGFELAQGGTLHVPVTYLRGYIDPAPRVPGRIRQQVKSLVEKLSGPDAESAKAQLNALGPKINALLDEIRASGSKETREQIDAFRGVKKD